MRIGDAAAAAGTTQGPAVLRGARPAAPTAAFTATGQRRYGADEVARVRVIRELLGLGLTVEDLRGIADRVHLLAGDPQPPCTSTDSASPGLPRPARDRTPDRGHRREIDRLTRLRTLLAQRTGPA
ncbi:MerR family transcriptional regulator [Streptomyces sp. NPDC003015]